MIDCTELLGIPFVDKGRDRNTGLDCYGLVKEVYKLGGLNIAEYDDILSDTLTCGECLTNKHWQRIEQPKEPCLVCIRLGAPRGVVNHVGVYIGDNRFIHTRIKKGVVIDRLDSPAWRGLIEGYYAYISNN